MKTSPPARTQASPPALPAAGAREAAPPQAKATGAVAWLMDEVIPIPGTKVKIGLDPLLGAFSAVGLPVGDAVTNSVSLVALLEAVRRGLPFKGLIAIAGNILVNAGFGSFPVVGNIFSIFFRSNSRNRDLINQYLREAVASGKPASWWRVLPVIAGLIVFVVAALALNMLLWALLLTLVFQKLGFQLPELPLGF